MDSLDRVAEWLRSAERVVFLGGAGVSTLSGIPDFRSSNGVGPDFETILSHPYFLRYPEEFFRFYRERMLYPDAKPSLVHTTLAAWEKAGKLKAIVTQNIDGLHQAAGSKTVLELHGTVLKNHCMRCGKAYALHEILPMGNVPRCDCGGIIKPDVVLYGESLPEDAWTRAVTEIRRADLLLVAGTSLRVYPAAGLIHELRHGRLVMLNRDATDQDAYCDAVVHGELKDIFEKLNAQLETKL